MGFTFAGFIFTFGLFVAVAFYLLESSLSSHPEYQHLFVLLLLTLIAVTPPIGATLLYGKFLKKRPIGFCGKCRYNLTGNNDATHCPECGERIYRRQLRKAKVQ